MNRSLAIRRLWWKELRQLMPLVGLLVLVGVLLQVLAVLLPFGNQLPWREAAALLGMPGLFAAGVGALLIGQEKESRTLDWLRSLPVSSGDLVTTKLLVALLGLMVVWSVSFLLGWSTGAWDAIRDGRGGELIWPLHSVFLLLVGFATAWQLRSSMIALLLVVPLACLPLLFAGMHQSIVEWDKSKWVGMTTAEPTPWLMATYLILFSVGFALYGWRAGLKYLAPQAAPRSQGASPSSVAAGFRWPLAYVGFAPGGSRLGESCDDRSPLAYASIAPAPALLWQFIMQNRGGLLGLCALQVASLFLYPPLTLAGSLLAISWLGVLVFQGDSQQRRVHFLADRGVSPRLVWLTRHAVPFAMLLLWLLLFAAIGLWGLPEVKEQLLDSTTLALITTVVICVYLTAQWLGQIATSPIVSAISAPLLASAVAGYLIYCAVELEASWWSVLIALLVPAVATWFGTRDWMDRRHDRWMCGRHALLGVLFLLLPLSNFLWFWATYPSMSSVSRQELQLFAAQNTSNFGGPRDLFALYAKNVNNEIDTQGDHWRSTQAGIRLGLSQDAGAVMPSNAHITCIAAILRLRLSDQSREEKQTPDMDVGNYRQWLTLLLELHDRLRLSWRLMEQDQADDIEMWIVEELKATGARERLGNELLERIRIVLSNVSQRDAARRQAIALSWQHARYQQLGGYQLNNDSGGYVTTKDVWEASRRAGVVSELLLKSLDAKASELTQLRTKIGEMLGYDVAANSELSIENAQGERELLYFETQYNFIPGASWKGEWEDEGAKLAVSREP